MTTSSNNIDQMSAEETAAIEAELTRLVLGGRGPDRPELMVGFAGLVAKFKFVAAAMSEFGTAADEAAWRIRNYYSAQVLDPRAIRHLGGA